MNTDLNDENTLRKIVNKYYPEVLPKHTYILNLNRFWEKTTNSIAKTIIVNSDSFEINYLTKMHIIYKK